jgi:hypothetical protein
LFLERLELFWKPRVPDVVGAEIDYAKLHTVFYFARAKIVQKQSLFLELAQIFGDVFGKQNVARIAAAHHAVRQIQTGTSQVRLNSYVHHPADGSAVHAHA